MPKKRQKSVRGSALGNRLLMLSLNAKLKACVGKYLSHPKIVKAGTRDYRMDAYLPLALQGAAIPGKQAGAFQEAGLPWPPRLIMISTAFA